jgi:RNA polymerase sigma factor (sigma-70 family)
MPPTKFSDALSRLGNTLPATEPEVLDTDLLTRFANCRDELAFEELVRRYGSMVFGVCRRVIGERHLAEDAFQATFVVLATKAGSIRPRSSVSGWLYGVAYRTALRARTMSDRRRRRETLVETLPDIVSRTEEPVDIPANAIAVLEEEVARLPEHYRTAVVLCEFKGKSRKNAARQLGISEGTVSSRLAAARHKLALRLRQRGVALSAAGLSGALGQMSSASVPANLIARTVASANSSGQIPTAVATLSDGVLRIMLLHRLKSLAPVLPLTIAGVIICAWLALAGQNTPSQPNLQLTASGLQTPHPAAQPTPKVAENVQVPKSPNKLIFYRADRLNLIDPDGKNEKTVAEDRAKFYHGEVKFSPDGKRIAYLSHFEKYLVPEAGNHLPSRHLFVRSLDEKGPGTDLGGFRCRGYDFAWSPDGSQIAISEETTHHIIDIKTKEKTALNLPKGHFLTDWSPDGKYFLTTMVEGVFTPDSMPDARLYLMNRDGTELKVLTEPKHFNAFGRLSPDGKRVLYCSLSLASQNDPGGWPLNILDIATGKSNKVEDTPKKWQPKGGGICWSPDGKQIAYIWSEMPGDKKISHLVVCDADGKNAKTIASEKDTSIFIASIRMVDWR